MLFCKYSLKKIILKSSSIDNVIVFLVAIFIAWFVTFGSVSAESIKINLLADKGWSNYMGSTSTPRGLIIIPLGQEITHQDGSVAQQNPPVNLFGPRLIVEGDFRINATMRDIDGWAALRLYGDIPIVYDQWRLEKESISVEISTTTITVRIWDGTSSSSNDMRIYKVRLLGETRIFIDHQNDEFTIGANGRTLGSIPDHGILKSGKIWFGTDASPDSDGWLLGALDITSIGDGEIKRADLPSFLESFNDPRSLRNLALLNPHYIDIGVAVSFGPLISDEDYRKIAIGEFNMWTPENIMKPQFIHPRSDVYAFLDADTYVDIARLNNINVHGHALVYHKSNPKWMTEVKKSERQRIMVEHITTIVEHFKGRVKEWDVVNEPLSSSKTPYKDGRLGLESTLWYEAMGEKYIDIAFFAAKKADPNAKLYLNDYGLERDGERWDALLSLVKRLKKRNVPIYGVGFESHVYTDGDYSDLETLKRHMDELAKLGLKVRISEIDVTGNNARAQIDQYVLALDACLQSLNCTAFSIWGITDLYGSTTRSDRYPRVFGNSLIWDSVLNHKPILEALQKKLLKR